MDYDVKRLIANEEWVELKSCISLFPGLAKTSDEDRNLPLHLALSAGCDESVLRALLGEHPESAFQHNGKNQYPLTLALSNDASYSEEVLLGLVSEETAAGLSAFGESALSLSVSSKQSFAIVNKILKAYPAAIAICDEMDTLPLDEAISGNSGADIIELLRDASRKAETPGPAGAG